MSILIKGMEMPEKGDCKSLIIHSDGSVSVNLNSTNYRAVEVPTPHGRLIDEDSIPVCMTLEEEAKMVSVIEAEE